MKILPMAAVTMLALTSFGCMQRTASDGFNDGTALAGDSRHIYNHPMAGGSGGGGAMADASMNGDDAMAAADGKAAGASGKAPADPTSFDAISRDLTPSMKSTVERDIDIDAHIAYMKDMNKRSFWSDLGRMFYTDHPSRLSPFPVVDLSAQPR